MKFVLLFGDAAVGKMTVGQELAKITDLRLFHNHMAIEPILEIFGTLNRTAIERFREIVFEEFAKTDPYGLIFTYMWAFDCKADWDYVEHIKAIFQPYHTEFYYVELIAPQAIRLRRNVTENRLKNKPSKRNTAWSNQRLVDDDNKYRLVSHEGEIPYAPYLRINNANLSARDTAKMIKEEFDL